MGDADPERLSRLLGDPELAWLLERVRRRIEHGQPLAGPVTLRHASAAQRDAVQQLLGRPPRAGRALTVSLPELDRLLRRSRLHGDGLAAAVLLTGPVAVGAEARAAQRHAWEQAFAGLDAVLQRRPELARWGERLRSTGTVKRIVPDPVQARRLLDALARVIDALPGAPSRWGASRRASPTARTHSTRASRSAPSRSVLRGLWRGSSHRVLRSRRLSLAARRGPRLGCCATSCPMSC